MVQYNLEFQMFKICEMETLSNNPKDGNQLLEEEGKIILPLGTMYVLAMGRYPTLRLYMAMN